MRQLDHLKQKQKLNASCRYDTTVGYCQGLPFLSAILLLIVGQLTDRFTQLIDIQMPDEEAFCLLVRLMQSYGLNSHFQPEMPGLQLRLFQVTKHRSSRCIILQYFFQFDRLIEEFLPVLHVHFLREGVKSSMFASQWFLTMFSYRFVVQRIRLRPESD